MITINISLFSQNKSIEIGPNQIGINENLNITITIENEPLKNYSDFPKIEGLTKSGVSSSSSTNYINGKILITKNSIYTRSSF